MTGTHAQICIFKLTSEKLVAGVGESNLFISLHSLTDPSIMTGKRVADAVISHGKWTGRSDNGNNILGAGKQRGEGVTDLAQQRAELQVGSRGEDVDRCTPWELYASHSI